MKLGTKIALVVSLAFALVMAVATSALIADELDFVEEEMDVHGRLLGRVVASAAGETLVERGESEARELVREIDRHEQRIAIRWINLKKDRFPAVDLGVLDRLRRAEIVGRVSPESDDTLYTWVPIESRSGVEHVIQIAESLDVRNAHVGSLVVRIIAGALLGLALGAVIAYILGRRLIDRPIGSLMQVARRIGRGEFSRRADEVRGGELGALAREMNEMAANLERAREAGERQEATRKQLEAQLQHADRLATLGQLASGVAHEVGTPLQAITIRAELIAQKAGHIEGTRESVEAIKRQSQRVATIVRNLLRFARKQTPNRAARELGEIARKAISLVETARAPGSIEISARFDPDLPPVDVDEEQIEQVVINLVLNGIQAMPGGGRLTVGVEPGTAQPPADVEAPAEQYLCLYVEDEGGGIPEDVRSHLFEPFFTTKGVDEGTGLGLSIVYGIVREHTGWIDVETEVDRGSRFSVYLPVADEELR